MECGEHRDRVKRDRGQVRWAGALRLAAVALVAGLAAPAAQAVSFADGELYRFCTGACTTPTGLQLEAGDTPVEYASIPGLEKLDNVGATALNSAGSDYFVRITRSQLTGPTNPANVSSSDNALFQYQFDVAWYGTLNGAPLGPGEDPSDFELLFSMVALRLGPTPFSDPFDAGYVRSSFSESVDVMRDSPNGTLPAVPPDNWVNDLAGGQDYLGIHLPLMAPSSGTPGFFDESDLNFVSFSFQMALRDAISFQSGDAFQHVNAAFIRPLSVPEPGTLLLLGAGLAGLMAVRRRG